MRCAPLFFATWRFGVGDPTVLGWVITAGYLVTALLCLRELLSARRNLSRAKTPSDPWLLLLIVCGALGLNKQLDLQTLFIQIGRAAAISEHWYQKRRIIQLGFVIVLGILTLLCSRWLERRYSAFVSQHRTITLGLILVAIYCLLRAAAIDHLSFGKTDDAFEGRNLWPLEFVGVVLMLVGMTFESVLPAPETVFERRL